MGFFVQSIYKYVGNTLYYGGLAAIAVGFLYVFTPKFQQKARLETQRNEIMRKIDYKKSEIEALKLKQKRFDLEGEFVELIARQHRRIRNNEFLFVRVDE